MDAAMTPRPPRRRLRDRWRSQRGIALVTVVISIAVLTGLTADFSYQTMVDLNAAANARDELRAEYAARGVVQLSRLIIKVQQGVIDKFKSQIGDFQLASMSGPLMSLFAGKKEETEGIGAMVGIDAKGIKGVGLGDDVDVDINITSDDGRININCGGGFSSPNAQNQQWLALTMYALVYSPQYNRLFENPDAEGQYTTREELVRALIDWSDGDDRAFDLSQVPGLQALGSSAGASEDYHYDTRRDPYRAHNNYYDTLDELHLVRGAGDDFMATFGDVLTVYGGCKLNLGALNDLPLLGKVAAMRAMMSGGAKNPADPGLAEPNGTLLAIEVAKELDFRGSSFSPLTDPQELARLFLNPKDMTHLTLASGPQPNLIGVDIDPARLGNMLVNPQQMAFSRRTYRVEARADVGRAKRKITAVWDSRKIKQFTANPEKPGDAQGAWVYWREE
jgi:general secretion pathway protein K